MNPDQIIGALADTIRGMDVIQPADYYAIHESGTGSRASQNHGIVATSVDGWRAYKNRSCIWPLAKTFEWQLDWLADQEQNGYGFGGRSEIRSGIYLRYMADGVRAVRALAILCGETALLDAANRWLRCYLGISTLLALPGQSDNFTETELVHAIGPGALTGTGVSPWKASLTVCDCGGRSFSFKDAGEQRLAIANICAAQDLCEALDLPASYSGIRDALWGVRPDLSGFPVSPEEKDKMRAALHGDQDAAVYVAEGLVGTYPAGIDYILMRRGEEEAQSILTEYPGSSTAPTYSKIGLKNGPRVRVSVLVADDGTRASKTNPTAVEPGKAWIDGDRVMAQRDDKRFPVASLWLVQAPTFKAIWGGDGIRVEIPAKMTPEPEPIPTPEPRPKKKGRNLTPLFVAAGVVLLIVLFNAGGCF